MLLSLPTGPSKFRSRVVKRFFPATPSQQPNRTMYPNNAASTSTILTIYSDHEMEQEILQNEDVSTTYHAAFRSHVNHKFSRSRQKEVNGLFERNVSTLNHKDGAQGLRVYRARLICGVKNEGTLNVIEKFRLVIRGSNDKQYFLTHAPTVQRASQRLLLALGVCHNTMTVI